MSAHSEKRRRGGGRAGIAKRRSSSKINQMPWHLPVNRAPPIAPLTDQGVEAIHEDYVYSVYFLLFDSVDTGALRSASGWAFRWLQVTCSGLTLELLSDRE